MTAPTTAPGRHADVNGVHLYHETHGSGRPLVLLHGGLASGEMFAPLLPAFTADHQVVLVDLQGHGRTADVDRPLDARLMADDVAALIGHLGLGQADVAGYSMGGKVALQVAIRHPGTVRRLVAASVTIRRDAAYPDILAQQEQVGAAAAEFMRGTPMYELYQRLAPRPEDFPRLLDKIGAALAQDFDVTDDVRGLTVPTLIMAADADMAPPSHFVEVFGLLGGGRRDGGWTGEGRPEGGHALAILPGLTHYDLATSPLFAATALAFLDRD
ncbi:alpha/beta hydrolase [Kineococcus sp. NUM-3379]